MATVMDDDRRDNRTNKSPLHKLFDETRKRLVETGTRNRLVHVNRKNTRAAVVNVVNERSEDVYGILASGKAMRFLAIGKDQDSETDDLKLADAGEPGFDAERYLDAQLETRMGPDNLQKRLLKIAREAQTAEEESGVNILYLAMGFLTWFEDKVSAVRREAPLILLPVQLTRNQKTSAYDIRLRDDDIVTNLPLQQRLKDDFGLVLPKLEVDEEWQPSRYFEQVEAAVASQTNWQVDRDGIQLGFFSFAKLLMYRDLAPEAWPGGAIAEHALTRGLLYEGFEPEPPLIASDARLDAVLPPENIFHVVDADASQAIVIEEVRRGRNLVVQGPPGTGKSQTITNIIAAAVKEGKRVLFVAEKMAALSVVHDRLVKVGLRDICLELHSRTANKKDVLAELARTMMRASSVPGMPGAPAALTNARDRLNALAEVLHRPIGDSGETAYSVLGMQSRFIGMNVPAPAVERTVLATLPRAQMEEVLQAVGAYGALLASEGRPSANPFAGVQNLDLQPVELSRLASLLPGARDAVAALESALGEAIAVLGVDLPPTRAGARQVLQTLACIGSLPPHAAAAATRLLAEPDLARLTGALRAGAAWRAARGARPCSGPVRGCRLRRCAARDARGVCGRRAVLLRTLGRGVSRCIARAGRNAAHTAAQARRGAPRAGRHADRDRCAKKPLEGGRSVLRRLPGRRLARGPHGFRGAPVHRRLVRGGAQGVRGMRTGRAGGARRQARARRLHGTAVAPARAGCGSGHARGRQHAPARAQGIRERRPNPPCAAGRARVARTRCRVDRQVCRLGSPSQGPCRHRESGAA